MDVPTVLKTPAAATPLPPASAGKGKDVLGKDDFLKLLVEQLKHQDPLEPSKPEEMAAQLAQFSSLEQLVNLNQSLSGVADSSAITTLAQKANVGASLIGRHVIARSDSLTVVSGQPTSLTFQVGGSGGRAALRVVDKNGDEVATQDLGTVGAGRQKFVIDPGTVAPGEYTYEVAVVGEDGTPADVTTYSDGVVDSVQFEGGNLTVRAGNLSFTLDQIVEIDNAVSPSSTESSQP